MTLNDYKNKVKELELEVQSLKAEKETCSLNFNVCSNKIPSLQQMERDLKIFAKNSNILLVSNSFSDSICEDAISKFSIVTKVHTFSEANDAMRSVQYDLVIISGIDKISVLEELRILNPNICALFITDTHSDQIFLKLIEVGIDGFLYAPFSKEQFVYQLMSVAEKVMYKNLLKKYEIEDIIKQRIAELRDDIEKDVLLSNLKYKVSARDFLKKFKDTNQYDKVMDYLDDFVKLSEDFEGIMYDVIENNIYSYNLLEESIHYFTEAEKIVFEIGSFDEIGLAFGELIIIYEKQDSDSLENIDKDIYKMINSMQHDLMKLLKGIFIKEDLLDINYLDEFFVNNIFRIKEKLGLATTCTKGQAKGDDEDIDLSEFLL
jgi:AmiR/NasT family two-component response regulator